LNIKVFTCQVVKTDKNEWLIGCQVVSPLKIDYQRHTLISPLIGTFTGYLPSWPISFSFGAEWKPLKKVAANSINFKNGQRIDANLVSPNGPSVELQILKVQKLQVLRLFFNFKK
jgi:hypothetical protein